MLEIKQLNNTWLLKGALNKNSSPKLWQRRFDLLQKKTDNVIIDLAEISRTDSAGLATLIALFKLARDNHKEISFCNASKQLHDIARVGGVESILPFD